MNMAREGQGQGQGLGLGLGKWTLFQRAVWMEVMKIPFGQKRTYGDIARRIGKPRAVRAVASAIGRNPFLVLIPCHRVVPATGKDRIGNFALGRRLKRGLLAFEEAQAQTSRPLAMMNPPRIRTERKRTEVTIENFALQLKEKGTVS